MTISSVGANHHSPHDTQTVGAESDSPILKRKSIRLRNFDYSAAGAYFITICTKDKQMLLGNIVDGRMHQNAAGQAVEQCWCEIPKHYPEVSLGDYIVMPNHIHGILLIHGFHASVQMIGNRSATPYQNVGANDDSPLRGTSRTVGAIVRGFKVGVAKRVGVKLWQRNYYEHIIRNQQSYEQISRYIVNNPINWWTDCYYGANDDSPLQMRP